MASVSSQLNLQDARRRLAYETCKSRVKDCVAALCYIAMSVAFAYVVYVRYHQGQILSDLLNNLQSNPKEYFRYMNLIPHSPFQFNYSTSVHEDFATEFGHWIDDGKLLENHCDSEHINMLMNKEKDSTYCIPGSRNSMGCLAGYFRDKSSRRVKSCPDGFFCPDSQVCFIVCALGGQCNQSRLLVAIDNRTVMMPEEHASRNSPPNSSTPTPDSATESPDSLPVSVESVYPDSFALPVDDDSLLGTALAPTDIANGSLPLEGGGPKRLIEWFNADKTCVFLAGTEPNKVFNNRIGCPGVSSLKLCPKGHYCPTPIDFLPCPMNHYCPLGSNQPMRCPPFAKCDTVGLDVPQYSDVFTQATLVALALLIGGYHVTGMVSTSIKKNRDLKNGRKKRAVDDGPGSDSEDSGSEATLVHSIAVAEPRIDLAFQELGLRLHGPEQRQVLAGVTGEFRHGRLAAIMGPSGVGKTTFLNTLCGRATYGAMTGDVMINGKRDSLKKYTHLIGLVPQDDTMHSWLSIKENLFFYAMLRRRVSRDTDINRKVDNIMRVLGLFPSRHAIIGDERKRGISGGQRKRVNVAMELVLDPSVLFLDEPTSGLDSTTSYDLVQALRTVASSCSLSIVAVVHQPSAKTFRLFHDVLLLGHASTGVGGATVYLGPSDSALEYFQKQCLVDCPQFENPADFMMDIIAGKVPLSGGAAMVSSYDLASRWSQYSQREEGRREPSPPSSDDGIDWSMRSSLRASDLPGFFDALWLLSFRAVIEHARFPAEFLYEIGLQLFTGLVVGGLYQHFTFKDLQQMNFMLSLALGFTIALSSMRIFGESMLVYWREGAPGVGMGINRSAYFYSKCVVELPRLALLTLALLSTFYPMASPRCPFAVYFVICFAASFAISGFAYIFSIAQDPKSAQLSIVVCMVVFSMFCGVAPRLSEIDDMGIVAQFVAWCSFARWYIECLYTEETTRLTDAWRMPPAFYGKASQESALLGLANFGYVEGSTPDNVLLLLFMGVGTRVIALVALTACNRGNMGLHTPSDWVLMNITQRVKRDSQQSSGVSSDMVSVLLRNLGMRTEDQEASLGDRETARLLVSVHPTYSAGVAGVVVGEPSQMQAQTAHRSFGPMDIE